MADTLIFGLFPNVDPTARAVAGLQAMGIADDQVTIMSAVPYSSKLFGRKRPRTWFLPFLALGALGGLAVALFITIGTPKLYPIYVGGQPLIAPFPPTAIMVFEFVALGAMIMAFLGFLLTSRFPRLEPAIYDERISDGYIGLGVRASERLGDEIAELFRTHGAVDVRREDAALARTGNRRFLAFWAVLGVVALGAALTPLLLTYNIIKIPWINVMYNSPAVGYQEGPRRAAPEGSVPFQGPRLVAGEPATMPLEATENSLQRGGVLFGVYCAICHGYEDGSAGSLRDYFPEVPPINSARVQSLEPDDVFLTITRGLNRMPSLAEQLTTGETWDIVNYVLSLEEGAAPAGQ
ncbi:MAG: quinol:electron acceptor oxidoreductase subunit ActD [Chloroflexota bacterium]|mgnify:FL=1